jgi:hypothetical protein
MPPARRLRSLLARLLRVIADLVQPPGPATPLPAEPPAVEPPAVEPAAVEPPAVGAGNEHWLRTVRARAPELLTGDGIHAGGTSAPAVWRQRDVEDVLWPQRHVDASPETIQHADRRPRRPLRPRLLAPLRAVRQARNRGVEDVPKVAFGTSNVPKPALIKHGQPAEPPARREPAEFGSASSREPARLPAWPELPGSRPIARPEFDLSPPGGGRDTAEFPPATPTAHVRPTFAERRPQRADTRSWTADTRTQTADTRTWMQDTRTWTADTPGQLEELGQQGWPELPDDEPLWQVPVSVFDAETVRRLDDEQRGW